MTLAISVYMVDFIQAELLIDGKGDILNDAVVQIEKGKITKVAQSESIRIPEKTKTITTPVLMPGMWDCHTHMFGGKSTDMTLWMAEPTSLRAIRTTRSVRNLIAAGYTSVRDVGGPYALRLKKAISEGVINGPNIYAAHKFISQTAGHGDHHPAPLDFQSQEAREWYSHLADGVAECRKKARENIREGADLIKIMVTGGVFSHIDSPTQAHFSMDELRAIIEEARRFDLPTAAHAHGLQGIKNAIDAGITTIEHGTFLDEDTAELMKEKKVMLVPTLYILWLFLDKSEELGLPEHIVAKGRETFMHLQENVKIAVDTGVEIASGSDLLGLTALLDHGHHNASEVERLSEAGLTPMQAIMACTSKGPKTLGKRAPKSGVIAQDYDADLLCLTKNPLEDLRILQDPQFKTHVIKSGKVVEWSNYST